MSKDSLGVMLTKNGYILTDEDDGSFGYMKFGDDDSFHSVTYNDENMYFFLLYAKINHPRQIDSAELRCTAIPFKIVGNQYRYNCNIKDQEYGIMLYILDSQGKILIEENESDSDDKLTFSEQVAIRPTKWE